MFRSTTILLSFLALILFQLSYANPVTKSYPAGGDHVRPNDPELLKILEEKRSVFEKAVGSKSITFGTITNVNRLKVGYLVRYSIENIEVIPAGGKKRNCSAQLFNVSAKIDIVLCPLPIH